MKKIWGKMKKLKINGNIQSAVWKRTAILCSAVVMMTSSVLDVFAEETTQSILAGNETEYTGNEEIQERDDTLSSDENESEETIVSEELEVSFDSNEEELEETSISDGDGINSVSEGETEDKLLESEELTETDGTSEEDGSLVEIDTTDSELAAEDETTEEEIDEELEEEEDTTLYYAASSLSNISQEEGNSGLNISKTLYPNDDGTLQIELENYVTGQTVSYSTPSDIILLLDTSGSMNRDFDEQGTRLEALQTATVNYIASIAANNEGLPEEYQSRVALVEFNAEVNVLSDFTIVDEETEEAFYDLIADLEAGGETHTDEAVEMAQELFSQEQEEDRIQSLILFTDGYPRGDDDAGFVVSVANRALATAKEMKQSGVTIYCVSIHPLANAEYSSLPTYENNGENYYFTSEDSSNSDKINSTQENAAALANRFMYLLSSCNPDADNVDSDGKTTGDNGEKYYFTANSTSGLTDVFSVLAEEVGLADIVLGEEAQAVDFITSDFYLADASEIHVYTAAYEENGSWGEREEITDQVTITVDGQKITVSGFDYAENYVSETPHAGTDANYGQKLIISFPIVPEPTFGGNQIETNETGSGLYQNAEEDEALEYYAVPTTDLELNYEIVTQDVIAYVPDTATITDLVDYVQGYIPDGKLNAYVDITYTLTDETGQIVGSLSIPAGTSVNNCCWDLLEDETEECGTYMVTCTISPIESGTYETLTLTEQPSVHIYHPQLILKDSTRDYGDVIDITVGDLLDENGLLDHFEGLSWICDDGNIADSADVPQLGYRVLIEEGIKIEDGIRYIHTKDDIPVVISVFRVSDSVLTDEISDETEFLHECGVDDCSYDAQKMGEKGIRCLIHVKTKSHSGSSGTHDNSSETVYVTQETNVEELDEEIPSETNEGDGIDEENAPRDVPQTGDSSEMIVWMIIMVVSAMGFGWCLLFRRLK